MNKTMQVTFLRDRISIGNDVRKEKLSKLNGNFDLLINDTLSDRKKIEQFGREPLAFYLYKKRLFFQKIIKGNQFIKHHLICIIEILKKPVFQIPKLGIQKRRRRRRISLESGKTHSTYFQGADGTKTKKINFQNMIRHEKIDKLKKKLRNLSEFTSIIEVESEEEDESEHTSRASSIKLKTIKENKTGGLSKQSTFLRSTKKYNEKSFFKALGKDERKKINKSVASQQERLFKEILELYKEDPKLEDKKFNFMSFKNSAKLIFDIDPELRNLAPKSLWKRASNLSGLSGFSAPKSSDVLKPSAFHSFQNVKSAFLRQSTILHSKVKDKTFEDQIGEKEVSFYIF